VPNHPEHDHHAQHEHRAGPQQAAEEREEILRLRVGMHCEGCAATIAGSLPTIHGVRSAVADHQRGVVEVVYLQGKLTEGQVRDHLRKPGYQVEGHAKEGKGGPDGGHG
jgi:copper chaperone CopZ